MRKSIVRLSMVVSTGIDVLAAMPVADLGEVMADVVEVNKESGGKK